MVFLLGRTTFLVYFSMFSHVNMYFTVYATLARCWLLAIQKPSLSKDGWVTLDEWDQCCFIHIRFHNTLHHFVFHESLFLHFRCVHVICHAFNTCHAQRKTRMFFVAQSILMHTPNFTQLLTWTRYVSTL